MEAITIISLLASIITLLAVWGRISSICENWWVYRKGGVRTTYMSGAYIIRKGFLDGELIYKSSDNKEDYIQYRGNGMIEHIEEIPPFRKWKISHWNDDIRVPNYSIRLLT